MVEKEFSLSDLAEQAGVPARTIRYYISRGLLAGPLKAGRGAAYSEEHLRQLRRIAELQARGLMLAEIARDLQPAPARAPEAAAWWEYEVADGVKVLVRGDLSPWRLSQVRGAIADMTARISSRGKTEGRNDRHGSGSFDTD